jgi:hypothetical protein
MSEQPPPDHTEDPRKQGIGQGGYPEVNPEEAVPDAGTEDDADQSNQDA